MDVQAILNAAGKGKYWYSWMPTVKLTALAQGWTEIPNEHVPKKMGHLQCRGVNDIC